MRNRSGEMTRTWLLDGRAFARKVKNPTLAHLTIEYGAYRECPNCHHRVDNSDVSVEWPGLPAGVKFDPSDAEILEHLEAKCGISDERPHIFIDEFIPTLDGDQGICYTHPEYLPGAKKDGTSVHFFHRTTNAYATGQRKRRKIQSPTMEHVRWHKTGKTKPVIVNGIHKGCKKIMVLYKCLSKGSKPEKSNWVMHQYHLGTDDDEKEGQYVISKVFYQQPKQSEDNGISTAVEEDGDIVTLRTSPRTPRPNPPYPPRPADEDLSPLSAQESKLIAEQSHVPAAVSLGNDQESMAWLAGDSQAVEDSDLNGMDDTLLCNEIFDSSLSGFGLNNTAQASFAHNSNDASLENNSSYGITDLENLELDTPLDFSDDLQFGSQDSIFGWLDRL